jgi:hypothetical protein
MLLWALLQPQLGVTSASPEKPGRQKMSQLPHTTLPDELTNSCTEAAPRWPKSPTLMSVSHWQDGRGAGRGACGHQRQVRICWRQVGG